MASNGNRKLCRLGWWRQKYSGPLLRMYSNGLLDDSCLLVIGWRTITWHFTWFIALPKMNMKLTVSFQTSEKNEQCDSKVSICTSITNTLLKRSDMARVSYKGSHSFTCHPHTNHTCLYSTAAEHHRPLAGTHCAYTRRDGQAELTNDRTVLIVDDWQWNEDAVVKQLQRLPDSEAQSHVSTREQGAERHLGA